MTTFHYLDTVDSPQSARRFLEELERAGLLYHPEESAQESIAHHGLAPWALAQIDRNMKACFDHLADPCDDALAVMLETVD